MNGPWIAYPARALVRVPPPTSIARFPAITAAEMNMIGPWIANPACALVRVPPPTPFP